MNQDRLTGWEKAALLSTGAASAFNVLLWALSATLADAAPAWSALGGLRVTFAVVSFLSLDLVVVVVVMAFRAGRRGFWSEVAAGSAALFAGFIALEVAGVVAWPWLHLGPALVLYAFMRHLATPPGPTVAQVRAELDQLIHEADQGRASAEVEAGRAWEAAEAARAEVARLKASMDHAAAQWLAATQETDRLRFDADDLRAELARLRDAPPALADQLDSDVVLAVAGRSYSLAQLAQALDMSKTTMGRRLAVLNQKESADGR